MWSACPGSSPLARGTPALDANRTSVRGLIPARAGNTRGLSVAAGADGAHPRSRGEHFLTSDLTAWLWGSSPLARGTPRRRTLLLASLGLIPARAGNTPPARYHARGTRAHPRSRGEHRRIAWVLVISTGSSPLARGTQAIRLSEHRVNGLIPARAGNTPTRYRRGAGGWAHPRSRGEHTC